MAASASVYSGSFEFVDDDDPAEPMQIQRGPRSALEVLPAAAPSSSSPSVLPTFQTAPLLYVRSSALQQLSARSPVNADRPALVHALVEACGLLEDAEVLDPPPATMEQLREFHSQVCCRFTRVQ